MPPVIFLKPLHLLKNVVSNKWLHWTLGTLNVIMLNRKGLLLQPRCVYVQAILNQTFHLVDFKEQFKVFRSLAMLMFKPRDHGRVYLAFYFSRLYLGFKTCSLKVVHL